MKRHLLLLLALLVSAALFTLPGCDKKETPAGEPTMGTITGKVVAMNGTTPIPMATVFVDADGEIISPIQISRVILIWKYRPEPIPSISNPAKAIFSAA